MGEYLKYSMDTFANSLIEWSFKLLGKSGKCIVQSESWKMSLIKMFRIVLEIVGELIRH